MIFVFLPAYNEEEALPRVVSKLDVALKKFDPNYRVVVLDDGSSDQTKATAEALSTRYPLTLLAHAANEGLGQTMIDGLQYVAEQSSLEDLLVTLDCDDTHEPQYIPAAVDKIQEGFDVVILSRYQKGGGERGLSFLKSFLSRGAGIFLKILFPIADVKEYSCGFRVIRCSALKKAFNIFGENFVKLAPMGFVVTPEILIKFRMMGCRITEVPFVLNYDQKPGKSKNKPLKTIAGYFFLTLLYCGRKISSHGVTPK